MEPQLKSLQQSANFRDARRRRYSRVGAGLCLLVSTFSVFLLVILLALIFAEGHRGLSVQFFTNGHVENQPQLSGISQSLVGSVALSFVCGLVALPLGVATAICLEEFKPRAKWLRRLQQILQININNLAGIPSVVYGILGVTAFVYMFSLFDPIQANERPVFEVGTDYFYQVKTLYQPQDSGDIEVVHFSAEDTSQLSIEIREPIEVVNREGEKFRLNVISPKAEIPADCETLKRTVVEGTLASRFAEHHPYHFRFPLGRSVLAAGLTLALVILPMVIIVSQEAIRQVPTRLREGALALGATRWQMVRETVLPTALPGIMTGAILSMSRAVGEAAPLIAVMGGLLATTRGLTHLMDPSPALPVTIYKWTLHPNNAYDALAATTIIVLLLFLILMNSLAIWIRQRFELKRERT